jgi:hypothetical protein
MMKKTILAASAAAVLAASPALAISAHTGAKTGTSASHVQATDAQGGYTAHGDYIRPHDRIGANDPFWRVNPVTGSAALAFAPVAGVFGYDAGYRGYDAYAQAPAYGYSGAPVVVEKGQVVGWDPDPNVRLQLRRGAVQFE